jgi:uncharacterized membrane protein
MLRLEETLHAWLNQQKINVPFAYLEDQLLSHPNYPSVLCVTETLTKLNIENAAIQIEPEKLTEIPLPALAHVVQGGRGSFVILENLQGLQKEYPQFYQEWDGVVVIAESANVVLPEQIAQARRLEKSRQLKVYTTIAVIAPMISILFFRTPLVVDGVFNFFVITGIVISFSIVLQELGVGTIVGNQLCGKNKDSDCNKITQSKGASLAFDIKLSDASLSFFLGIASVRCFMVGNVDAGFVSAANTAISLILFGGILFTLYSLYLQTFVLQKYCALCNVVIGAIWSLAIIRVIVMPEKRFAPLSDYCWVASVFVVPGLVWLIIRESLNTRKEFRDSNLSLRKFKRNPNLFLNHLMSQDQVEFTAWQHDLKIGNPEAPIQITMACAPYCKPCAEAHKTIDQLIERFSQTICVTVRFSLPEGLNRHSEAVSHILKCAQTMDAKDIIHDWFETMDLDKFKAKYSCNAEYDVDDLLKQHWNWVEHAAIQFTPTFFINGFQLASPYAITDVSEFIYALEETFRKELVE